MPSIRRSPLFRGSAFIRLTEGIFGGCHRFKSVGFESKANTAYAPQMLIIPLTEAGIDLERVKLGDLPRGVIGTVQHTSPPRSAEIDPIVAHVELDEDLSHGNIGMVGYTNPTWVLNLIIDAMSLLSLSDGLGMLEILITARDLIEILAAGLDFELEYPLTDTDASSSPSDQLGTSNNLVIIS